MIAPGCVHPHTPSQAHLLTRQCYRVLADSLTLRWSGSRLQNIGSLPLAHFNVNNSPQCQPRMPHSMQDHVVAFSGMPVGEMSGCVWFTLNFFKKQLRCGYWLFAVFFLRSCLSSFQTYFENMHGIEEMAQWLRILAALAEDLGSIPSTHMLAHSYPVPREPMSSLTFIVLNVCRGNTHTH